MKGEKALQYHRLFSDGIFDKGYQDVSGLKHCQVSIKKELYQNDPADNHRNRALFGVSVAKWHTWVKLPEEKKKETSFSMRTIKTCCMNTCMKETIFCKLKSGYEFY